MPSQAVVMSYQCVHCLDEFMSDPCRQMYDERTPMTGLECSHSLCRACVNISSYEDNPEFPMIWCTPCQVLRQFSRPISKPNSILCERLHERKRMSHDGIENITSELNRPLSANISKKMKRPVKETNDERKKRMKTKAETNDRNRAIMKIHDEVDDGKQSTIQDFFKLG